MLKIRCGLDFDPYKDLGLCDKVDPETGEVIQTAWEAVIEGCREHPDIRPCAKRGLDGKPFRWVEKRRGCILGKHGRCEYCLEVIEE